MATMLCGCRRSNASTSADRQARRTAGAVTSSSGSSASSAGRRTVRTWHPHRLAPGMPTWPDMARSDRWPMRRAVRSRRRRLAGASADPRLGRRRRPTARRRASGPVRHQQLRRRAVEEQEAALAAIGIPAAGDVLTSAQRGRAADRARRARAGLRRRGRRRGRRRTRRQCGRWRAVPSTPSSSAFTARSTTRRCSSPVVLPERRPPDRHQRRRDVPDAGRADPWRRRDPRVDRHGVRRRTGRRRQAARADGGTGARDCRRRRGASER